jgi:hypothetical protein
MRPPVSSTTAPARHSHGSGTVSRPPVPPMTYWRSFFASIHRVCDAAVVG